MNGATRVAVLGGGPAGLAAAIAARLRGFDVTVVEHRRPPIDKACGEGIMPDGAELLERLGVDIAPPAAIPFKGLELIEGSTRARACFRGRPGFGARRTVLHDALVRRATELGVDLRWGRTVRGLHTRGALLDDGLLAAGWIIGADGMNSLVRRTLGLDVAPLARRFGIRRHYHVVPWTDAVQVHWADRAEAYVTPVGPAEVCVAILHSDPSERFERALTRFPELERRLAAGTATAPPRGAGTVFRRAAKVVKGRVALVGDAAGSVDAITGAGITLALHQAVLLADSLAAEDLAAYEASYRDLMRVTNHMTSFMLRISRSRALRRLTLRTLAAAPWLLAQLLRLHTRAHPLSAPGARIARDRAPTWTGGCRWNVNC